MYKSDKMVFYWLGELKRLKKVKEKVKVEVEAVVKTEVVIKKLWFCAGLLY